MFLSRKLGAGTKLSHPSSLLPLSRTYLRTKSRNFWAPSCFYRSVLGPASVNDPYVLNGWAEKREAKDAIEFCGDFDGNFHKSLDLGIDLSAALLGPHSCRWSAYVVDEKVKVLNVEKAPSDFTVSSGEVILEQIHCRSSFFYSDTSV
ncbi:hypothetical protein F0562_000283 [Nyssa sinensis]|uniref:Uncharacterized protein n=1 Tax=Nyssa sinensis TaxID=561372 RepID=A0A5J5C061_9ASTE|nr:hypothetical protein F0562_000283 [Nyssa sinensis]